MVDPHLEEMVREKIASGCCSPGSEVVREQLRLLEQADEFPALELQKLREDIREGLNSRKKSNVPLARGR